MKRYKFHALKQKQHKRTFNNYGQPSAYGFFLFFVPQLFCSFKQLAIEQISVCHFVPIFCSSFAVAAAARIIIFASFASTSAFHVLNIWFDLQFISPPIFVFPVRLHIMQKHFVASLSTRFVLNIFLRIEKTSDPKNTNNSILGLDFD